MAEAAAPLQVMAKAAALSKVLAQVKCNIDELSPIECEAAYVAVASPSDLSKKGSVLILLDPGGEVKDSADAKSLMLCCCNSSDDPTGELSMGMGDIMGLVALEKGHTSVACAMPELARRERSGVYWEPKGAAAERAGPISISPHQIPVNLGGSMPCSGL